MKKSIPLTQSGHNLYEISSLLQKAIRRGHAKYAGYAACEMMVRYRPLLWKRLRTISAEDCYGCVTQEIIALQQADEMENGKNGVVKSSIYIAKALTLLIRTPKNRDADWLACNLINSRFLLDIDKCHEKLDKLPDYTYDVHTLRGKYMGKTKEDMIRDEQNALHPHKEGLFDKFPWDEYLWMEKNGFLDKDRIWAPKPTDKELAEINDGCVQTKLF